MKTENAIKKAVILFSGGLDSTTVLAKALKEGYECHTLGFDYGQRHRVEVANAKRLSAKMGVTLHKQIALDTSVFAGSALTDHSIKVPSYVGDDKIPVTYVPARNLLFLSYALSYAESIAARTIMLGVSNVDYSGYPDCRPAFIQQFEQTANLATKAGVSGEPFSVLAPLVSLNKAQTIQMGMELGVDYSLTISCYQATPEGLASGHCDSCVLRKQGFAAAGIADPTKYC